MHRWHRGNKAASGELSSLDQNPKGISVLGECQPSPGCEPDLAVRTAHKEWDSVGGTETLRPPLPPEPFCNFANL